ncbi:MAG: AAA family ATPase, partial [Deltaproteobacteria bacterium]
RQSFLNGSLTRLLAPDTTLRTKIVEFVSKGDFGLASGQKPDGTYERVWFNEPLGADEVAFESGVFLLLKSKAKALKIMPEPGAEPKPTPVPEPMPVGGRGEPIPGPSPEPEPAPTPSAGKRKFRISGEVPPEIWNRLGTKVLPKLRNGSDLKIEIEFSVTIDGQLVQSFETDLKQILEDLGLTKKVKIQ